MDVSVDYKDGLTVYVHETPQLQLWEIAEKFGTEVIFNNSPNCRTKVHIGNLEITFFA